MLALASLAAGAVLMLRLAARVYRGLLLRTGTRVGWREAFRVAVRGEG